MFLQIYTLKDINPFLPNFQYFSILCNGFTLTGLKLQYYIYIVRRGKRGGAREEGWGERGMVLEWEFQYLFHPKDSSV